VFHRGVGECCTFEMYVQQKSKDRNRTEVSRGAVFVTFSLTRGGA
jgi:hypothetical protein